MTDANELLDAAAAAPTLDEMMRRDPAALSKANRVRLVELQRQERATYIKAEAERKRR